MCTHCADATLYGAVWCNHDTAIEEDKSPRPAPISCVLASLYHDAAGTVDHQLLLLVSSETHPTGRSGRRRVLLMQGPRSDEALRGLDGYEQMVDNFAEQAKVYWRLWARWVNRWSAR